MSSTAVRPRPTLRIQDHSAGLRLGQDGVSDNSHQARGSSGPMLPSAGSPLPPGA